MNKLLTLIFFFSLILISLPAHAFEGGKVIVDLHQEDKTDILSEIPNVVSTYIDDIKKYDIKYPGQEINEDFLDEVISDYPDSPDEKNITREKLIRYGIQTKRIYNKVVQKAKDFIIENDIPFFVSSKDYGDVGAEKYLESTDGKPIVVLDFKKAVSYSQTDSEKQIIVDNDEEGLSRYQRIQELKKAIVNGDYKKVLTYGMFDGKDIEDSKGVGNWTDGQKLKARLISIPKGIAEKDIHLALQIYIPKGNILLYDTFKQYAGLSLQFSGDNFQNLKYNYPVPYRFPLGMDDSLIGFYDTILIPVELEVKDITKPVSLVAEVKGNICQGETCLAESLTPSLTLEPMNKVEDAKYAAFIRMSEYYVPKTENSDIKIRRLLVENYFDKQAAPILRVEIDTPKAPVDIDVIISGEGVPALKRPLISIDYSKVTARFQTQEKISSESLIGKEFTVTVRIKDGVSLRRKVVVQEPSVFDNGSQRLNFGLIWLGFLGGLLLNLMPCVFPVLSLKLLSFTEFGGRNFARIRKSFIYNVLGIGVSFALITLMLVILRYMGASLGWGVQFQSIYFLIFISFVVTVFLAQIMGIVNINAPGFVGKILHKQPSDGRLGSFLSGLFLVLLSTPCSAPYLGTAIGFALGSSIFDIVVIMTAVCVGLAFPYILIALYPRVSTWVPRPGKWMQTVNILMRLMLVLTVIWLLSLIAAQTGSGFLFRMILYLLALLTILGFRKVLFMLINQNHYSRRITHHLKKFYNYVSAILIAILLVIAFIDGGYTHRKKQQDTSDMKLPELIAPDEITGRLILGRKVLVRVGADWCLSCHYNDFAVFNNTSFEEFAMRNSVDIVDIDWSNYNEDVLNFMARYGRRGIPFYILYSRRMPEGLVLPEILDESGFRELIEKLDY